MTHRTKNKFENLHLWFRMQFHCNSFTLLLRMNFADRNNMVSQCQRLALSRGMKLIWFFYPIPKHSPAIIHAFTGATHWMILGTCTLHSKLAFLIQDLLGYWEFWYALQLCLIISILGFKVTDMWLFHSC